MELKRDGYIEEREESGIILREPERSLDAVGTFNVVAADEEEELVEEADEEDEEFGAVCEADVG